MSEIYSASKINEIPQFRESEIWRAGEDNLETYYIYGLLAARETIYAFAEGRIKRRDKDAHHIVLKKSTDGGESWSKNQFIVRSNNNECFCNPTPIFERQSGKIFLFYALNYDNTKSELYLISSTNKGESWSEPEKLTKLFENNDYNWTFHLPGPGHGIQMRNGRLIMQFWHRRPITFLADERNYGVSVIYSDDGGENWQMGGIIPLDKAPLNESRLVELENGDLLLNARSGAFVTSPRYSSESKDGGLSWYQPQAISSLPEAFATDAGFANLQSDGKDLLILTRPDDKSARKDLTIYVSENTGKSWQKIAVIYKGVAGYSDCVILADKSIGVIYGRDFLHENADVEGNVKRTMFARLNLNQSGL